MNDSRVLGAIGAIVAVVALLVVAVVAILNQPSAEVTLGGVDQTGLSVTGTGSVTVTPDIAVLDLGVEVTAPTVAEARSNAADTMDAIMASIKDNGVDEKDVQTRYFNIYPQYSYKDNTAPQITGFTVSNQISVKVRNMDSTSKVLDDAIVAGGDSVRVSNISFTVDQPEQYLDEARDKAIQDARDSAEVLAKAAGVSVGGVRSISESSSSVPPQPRYAIESADAGAGGAATSISPGEQDLTVNVSVVFEIK